MFSQGLTFAQADSSGQTQVASAKKSRQEDKQTCLPVTIRAVEKAVEQRADAGGELRFGGTEPGVLLLVAMVEAMSKQAASIELSLNDATGRIKARHYFGNSSKQLDELAPGRYVSIFGSVRTAPEFHFAVAGMSMVESADEVSYHMIEAAYAALKLQKGPAEPTTPMPGKALGLADITPPKSETTDLGLMEPITTQVAQTTMPVKEAAPQERLSGSALRKAIFKFLQKEGEGKFEGMSFAAVCNHVEPAPAEDVSAALEKLVDAGEIYTTIDDGHYQVL